ncbi:TIGR04255 family protein, partial [Desulfobacterota bacterium AH_259_B03_O07]|nr:TIGR04255 family protein [Desulfobacterota bacterium AH_259_B03_O07]
DYPTEKTIRLHEAKIGVKDKERSVITHDKITGYRYESEDRTRIVQLRVDGFTFNRLKPYKRWKEVRDEALRLWNYYKELVKPEFIKRIALRYINNLNIPMPINDFRDYLTCPPEVPEGLPQGISSFFYRVVIPANDSRITAIITQALDRKVDIKDYLPIILD